MKTAVSEWKQIYLIEAGIVGVSLYNQNNQDVIDFEEGNGKLTPFSELCTQWKITYKYTL